MALTSLFGGPNVIWYTPPVKAPTTQPTSIPINRLPTYTAPKIAPPTTVVPDPVITGGTIFTSGGIGDAPPAGPAPTGPTTGTQTGSTGTSDMSRLFDLIAAGLAPQSITPTLSPTSVTDTSTVQPTSSGTSPLALLIVGIAIAGGIFWYMKHKHKRAAA